MLKCTVDNIECYIETRDDGSSGWSRCYTKFYAIIDEEMTLLGERTGWESITSDKEYIHNLLKDKKLLK